MTARARIALAATMVVPLAMVCLNAQSPATLQQTFRSAVDLVTIQASVRDARGRVVQGLTRADFEVRDNGQLRPVMDFRADRQSPVTVAILVDMSGSMSIGTKVAMARQAYQSVLSQLREQDEVALFTFDSSLHERQDFTQDLTQLKDALSTFEPFGTTSLYDATAATARRLADRTATHRAIVVLTDGIDTSSRLSAAEVSGLASSINVPVYVVATVPSIDQRVMMEATERGTRTDTADLRDLAEWTGGHLVFASTFTETIVVASSIVDELRQQYVLAIEAAPEREWRRLDVRVKNPSPSTTVKARSGYFGG
jgi:Ca-activated chloride channel homolog